ncbi:MAG: hypothetical protein RL095_2935 [Verrucomicrobiota bacterium]|jgi:hemerythrin
MSHDGRTSSETYGEIEMDAYHAEIIGLVHSIGISQSLREPLLVLQAFAARCFAQEEARMLSCHYPHAQRHLDEHARFLHLIQELADAVDPIQSRKLLAEMGSLVERHFEQEDHALMGFLLASCPTGVCSSEAFSPKAASHPSPDPLHLDIGPYLVHDDRIDVDHAQLIEIINALVSGSLPYGAAIAALEEYADYHFRMEEERMREVDYPEYAAHVAAHDNFRLRLRWLREKPDDAEMAPEMLHRYLGMWLINHILHVDRRLAVCLAGPR